MADSMNMIKREDSAALFETFMAITAASLTIVFVISNGGFYWDSFIGEYSYYTIVSRK